MPRPHDIIIREQPDHRAGPDSKKPEPVHVGDTVRFTTEPGATGVRITFSGPSPFADKEVDYNTHHAVTAAHKPGGQNIYRYNCKMTKGGRTLESTGGGEIEILSGEG